jgi:peroxiredoxin
MHATSGTADKARVGDAFPTLDLTATSGELVTIPDPAGDFVHLQLRRFAGCPAGNLHLRSIVTRHDEIRAHGIREVVVFHSTAAELAKHEAALPFPLIADPERELYRRLGVGQTGVLGPFMPTGGRTGCPTR